MHPVTVRGIGYIRRGGQINRDRQSLWRGRCAGDLLGRLFRRVVGRAAGLIIARLFAAIFMVMLATGQTFNVLTG